MKAELLGEKGEEEEEKEPLSSPEFSFFVFTRIHENVMRHNFPLDASFMLDVALAHSQSKALKITSLLSQRFQGVIDDLEK